jgi:2-oxoglutarate ferredoxin oxidoreductase subunit alpha
MTERVVIPHPEHIKIEPRKVYTGPKEDYLPFAADQSRVPAMAEVGEGYHFHVTGLTHNEKGYPVMTAEAQEKLVHRLVHKIRDAADEIAMVEEADTKDAEIVLVAYGITSRVVLRTLALAREKGLKVGAFRPVVVWPFPEKRLSELADQVKAFVVPELNYGQVVLEIERIVGGRAKTVLIPNAGGALHDPFDILRVVEEVSS